MLRVAACVSEIKWRKLIGWPSVKI